MDRAGVEKQEVALSRHEELFISSETTALRYHHTGNHHSAIIGVAALTTQPSPLSSLNYTVAALQ